MMIYFLKWPDFNTDYFLWIGRLCLSIWCIYSMMKTRVFSPLNLVYCITYSFIIMHWQCIAVLYKNLGQFPPLSVNFRQSEESAKVNTKRENNGHHFIPSDWFSFIGVLYFDATHLIILFYFLRFWFYFFFIFQYSHASLSFPSCSERWFGNKLNFQKELFFFSEIKSIYQTQFFFN